LPSPLGSVLNSATMSIMRLCLARLAGIVDANETQAVAKLLHQLGDHPGHADERVGHHAPDTPRNPTHLGDGQTISESPVNTNLESSLSRSR
jgi:hypothetical protein